ncbi:META domain-containing protein [Helicobacter sp. 11S03491-1]|uniref:META domain-containing protein n=1 Tax=Helicobacter sp. 11S03491-1 TaxID=1476196 RepID=UPI000BA5BD8C|nr:META domain-containing protein [Helicobacter sp. 11S03491-1]PAF41114.1 hypothetical protein BKH45_08290 [Helicobacter sp. 11S03491-1]
MRFVGLAIAIVFLSGCSVWNMFEGKIDRTHWQIEKIVVDGKEYLSPQSLKAEAMKNTESKEEDPQQAQQDAIQAMTDTQTIQPLLPETNTALPDSAEEVQKQSDPKDNQKQFLDINEISTMIFDQSQHRIYGIAGCNNYFASYAWRDSQQLEVGNTGMTRKLCTPDELMSFEFRFMRNFNGLFQVTKNKTSMVLDNGKMQIYLQ